ncbi:hypothetical protein Hanom_Chr17g01537241 [Helianthus anomalus]
MASCARTFNRLNETCNSDFDFSAASRAFRSRSRSETNCWKRSTEMSSVDDDVVLMTVGGGMLSSSSTSLNTAVESCSSSPAIWWWGIELRD